MIKRNQKSKNNKGFSLVELIIVIAIMAILAGILAPQFVKYVNRGKESTDIQNAQQIASALAVYYADHSTTAATTYTEVDGSGALMPGEPAGGTTIETVLGGIPEVKAETGKKFAFSIGDDGKVTVWVVPASGGTNTNGTELYPKQPASGKWSGK